MVEADSNAKNRQKLQEQVRFACMKYDTDSLYVSPQHNSLFKKHSLDDRLQHSNEYVASWLRLVHDA
jgi:DNA-dependent RNA polymerase auxiliary subunit epsilon